MQTDIYREHKELIHLGLKQNRPLYYIRLPGGSDINASYRLKRLPKPLV